MDKVTQAMLANKTETLTSHLVVGDSEKFLTNEEEKSHSKKREKSINEMEANRLQQQKDIEIAHQQRKDKREEMRNNIRNKYRLKGSPQYSGSYYKKRNNDDKGQNSNSEDEIQINDKKCSIQ